jgi:two-component system, OmpR family, phosphate regulon sensor histidine kinase PhoR
MWLGLILFSACAALISLHLWWRRRYVQLEAEKETQSRAIRSLEEQHHLALSYARDQQEALFNSMAEGVLVLDRDCKVLSANQSLEKLLGRSLAVRGQTVLEALRLHELSELVGRLPKEGTVLGFEVTLPELNARFLEVNATSVLDQAGERQGAILVFHDLTRLKQLENTRQEFVANVSHELRTPLSMIKGFVETLLEGAKDDPAVASRFLRTIEKHADRLTYLIEDLLTISRLESGQILMNSQRVELRDVAQRVVDDLQSRAAEKGVRMANLVPESLYARADADRLEQVLFNLVDNGIKYGRNQGQVTIGGQQGPDNKVEVWVRDDGPGIPPEARERVFERFYRVDKARSREKGGTGLGLSIVKHIVQAHGGEVSLQSELGSGTTFFFTVPPDDQAGSSIRVPPRAENGGAVPDVGQLA